MQNAEAARVDWTRARTLFEQMGAKPMLWRTHALLGQLAQTQKRDEAAEREFAAARAIVEELTAHMQDESLRANLLQRAAKVIPPLKPLTPRRAAKREFGGLTEREREIATRIAQGKSNREIADELIVSERTVTTHVSNVLSKLGFTSRAQIAAWVGEKGLARPQVEE
ncbi:MAG: response regulator transcription factor [Chloroflexi bacterium]|nr:response regulator transcription factor [Chloroflexota bacterium]